MSVGRAAEHRAAGAPHAWVIPCCIFVSPAPLGGFCLLPFCQTSAALSLRFPALQLDSGAGVGTGKAEKSLRWETTTLPHPLSPSQAARAPLRTHVRAELSGGCGTLPARPGLALGARTSPGSLERLCLLADSLRVAQHVGVKHIHLHGSK